MIHLVKQLTAGFCYITVWHGSGFTSGFTPGEQKKLKRLTLKPLLLILLLSIHLSAWRATSLATSFGAAGEAMLLQIAERSPSSGAALAWHSLLLSALFYQF